MSRSSHMGEGRAWSGTVQPEYSGIEYWEAGGGSVFFVFLNWEFCILIWIGCGEELDFAKVC